MHLNQYHGIYCRGPACNDDAVTKKIANKLSSELHNKTTNAYHWETPFTYKLTFQIIHLIDEHPVSNVRLSKYITIFHLIICIPFITKNFNEFCFNKKQHNICSSIMRWCIKTPSLHGWVSWSCMAWLLSNDCLQGSDSDMWFFPVSGQCSRDFVH